VVRSATSGSGSSVCGVAPGSYGSKELHYVLRTLSPAACRNHTVFTEVAKNILRINLVTLPKRGIRCHVFISMLVVATSIEVTDWFQCATLSSSPKWHCMSGRTLNPETTETFSSWPRHVRLPCLCFSWAELQPLQGQCLIISYLSVGHS